MYLLDTNVCIRFLREIRGKTTFHSQQLVGYLVGFLWGGMNG